MNQNRIFVVVSKNGIVFDRTDGKNNRLDFIAKHPMGSGYFVFKRENNVVVVFRYSESNTLSYRKELKDPGMYMLATAFVQWIPKTPKEIRLLHRKIRNILDKQLFKLIEEETLEEPFIIKWHLYASRGEFSSKFSIFFSPLDIFSNEFFINSNTYVISFRFLKN